MVCGLHPETLVGLPRTNLVKKSDPVAPPAAAVVTGPSLPLPLAAVAAPIAPATLAPSSLSTDMSRATDPGTDLEIEVVEVAPPPVPPPVRPAAPSIVEPSAQALLERAAALGPVRLTFESIALPDPVLEAKHEPRIAERRARLTRVVKVTLGACVGVCVLALGVSIFSSGEAQAATTSGKAMPSEVVKNNVALAGGIRGKATKSSAAPGATVAARPWGRPVKRR